MQRFSWPETLYTGHPLAIAHRFASSYAPDNTLKSFQIAADLAAEMWELDVHLSSDGVCVVTHADDLSHVAGRDLPIAEATWEEISKVRLPEGQHIPRLEEVIVLAQKMGSGLYIDIKAEGAGPMAWELLQDTGFKFACLGALNINWVIQLRKLGCSYPLAVLIPVGADPFDHLNGFLADIVHLCWRDVSAVPHDRLTNDLIAKLCAHNFQIVLWHEDRAEVLAAILSKTVLGICSDQPEQLKPYQPNTPHPVAIVCHRGANHLAPENTLEAAKICINQHFQYIELDVRTAADGELVVIHDATLERTTDGTGAVAELTLSEIKQVDAGGWFREGTAGYRVPTLLEFLVSAREQTGFYIEIKHADPDALLKIVTRTNMLAHCFFWSAHREIMQWLHQQSPDIILMVPRWTYSSVAEAVSTYGAEIVEFDVGKDDLSEISQCSSLGVKSMIKSKRHGWDHLASCLRYKPDLINLDRPDRFKILVSYPQVHKHFQTMLQNQSGEL